MVMENRTVLTFNLVEHPDARVQRVGFDLTDPYVEHCWGPVLGPTSTLLLRRMPLLWAGREPATITHNELSKTFGLGCSGGENSKLMRSIGRLVQFRLATWAVPGRSLDVRRQAPGLSPGQVERLPEWSKRLHKRLLDERVNGLIERDENAAKVATITARLDRLQRPRAVETRTPVAPARAAGR